jgi:hypothetical protein
MNGKVLTAATVAALSCLVSTVWAERPSEKASCEFPGGAYYKSNNTLYLESVNDENARIEILDTTKSCIDVNSSGEFNLVVERSTKLATNSTIVLPMNYSPKSSCIKLYDPYAFTTNDEGVWNVFASNAAGNGVAHRALLMITDTQRKECQDIKEIEFTASGLQLVNEHTQAQLERELHNPKSGANDWALEGSYNFIRWDKDHADLGKVYGYAAKDKNKVQAGHFTKVGAGAYIPPMRAYLKYRGQTPLAKSVESIVELPETIDVTLVEEDGTTRLARWNTVTGEMVKVNGWYDLKGRKLNSKPQNKGMFIGNTNIQK